MSSKDNHIPPTLAENSPCRYKSDEMGHNQTRKMQNFPIGCQIALQIQFPTFLKRCNTRKLQLTTTPADESNSFPLIRNNSFYPLYIQKSNVLHKFNSVASHPKCTVFQTAFKTKSHLCFTFFVHSIIVKKMKT